MIYIDFAFLKALLLSPDLKNYTAGVIFLGTPHRGSHSQHKAEIIAMIAAMAGVRHKSRLLAVVQEGSDIIEDMVPEFKRVVEDSGISLCCFFEQHSTDITAVIRP